MEIAHSALLLALSRSGRARRNDVKATRLNDQVHCGIDTALFKDADSTGVAAAPTIVDNAINGKLDGPNTETAQPIKTPLYPHIPSRHAFLSSPIILDVVMDVIDPKAAHAANVGSPSAKLASTTRPEVVLLRKITWPIALVAESRFSDCNISENGELGFFEVGEDGDGDDALLLFSPPDEEDGGGPEVKARENRTLFLEKTLCR